MNWVMSARFPGEQFAIDTMFCNLAIYTNGAEYVLRSGRNGEYSVVAGPFDSFEAACAAYEMLKNA